MNPLTSLHRAVSKIRQFNRIRVQKRRWRRHGLEPLEGKRTTPFACVEPSSVRPQTSLVRGTEPRVSIVIAAYGKYDYTLQCLASIVASSPMFEYEIIVVEDASVEPTALRIGEVPGVRFIVNEENLGYLRSCNRACQAARGEFLLLLNNDTEVMPGALDAMLNLAERDPLVGVVGAKLVFPDGRLQEAGCIAWKDGTAWNHGRFDDPMMPAYNYVREVDYASAACVLVRRRLWETLGGFDELYFPAYCEDLDLAFRARAQGYKVLYEPAAVVIHHEGVSHGNDEQGNGIKRFQSANQAKFRERWRVLLDAQHFSPGQHLLRARDRAGNRKTVLVIDHYLPELDRDAGSRSILDILKALQTMGHVVKFWPANQRYEPRYASELERRGIEVLQRPPGLYFPEWIQANGEDLDVVLVSRPEEADIFIPILRKHSSARLLYYGHDLHFARLGMEQQILGEPSMGPRILRMFDMEKAAWQAANVVFYPSTEEALRVRELEPNCDARRLTPYAVLALSPPVSPVHSHILLFVAGFRHSPNEDAAVWLVQQVLPVVQQACPEAKVVLAGADPTDRVKQLAGPAVTVTGTLTTEQLTRLYARARVAVVPLRVGAGVKFKAIEAMTFGVPVVMTLVGAQGLEDLPPQVQVVDSDVHRFAASVVHLLREDDRWLESSKVQRDYVQSHFNRSRIIADLQHAIDEVHLGEESSQPVPLDEVHPWNASDGQGVGRLQPDRYS